ncbi:hypothetical protein [Achromobacter marplatensis]
MPDDLKLPPPPPIHHRWAPVISESLAEALQVWCRTYARSAVLADRQQRAGDAKAWNDLFWSVAKELNCLPSSFVDGNAHVLRAARQAAAALSAHRDAIASPTQPSKDGGGDA